MGKYVTLELAKQHLIIEPSFTEDDSYIESLIEVGEENIAKDLCVSVDELETIGGGTMIPAPLRHAILLVVGTYYGNRESISTANLKELPRGVQYLTALYRDHTK
ncbi:head-tail connector protein [Bacteroides sp.]|uniref:head-tail connector protein n=1 Tax=Bacteroides sp. TaxID=29523 RepID=UPI0020631CA7|nr:head-tail connector protein [Bacteroides sp.]DAY10895.1 MAG TPA: Head Tail Connector Protein [Caudoviricetes sp.]